MLHQVCCLGSLLTRALRDGERYMVFVDRNPMAPDESVRSLTDDTCKATPGCPDTAYLTQNFIFPTRGTSIEVPWCCSSMSRRRAWRRASRRCSAGSVARVLAQ